MISGVLQNRFWYTISKNQAFVYDCHIHRVTPLEVFGDSMEAVEAFIESVQNEFDLPLPDIKSRTRIRNLKLSLSGKCNLDCTYCFRNNSIPEIRDETVAFQAIDAMLNDFGRDAPDYSVSFNMTSEPLLHIGLLDRLIDYTAGIEQKTGKTIYWYVLTNGTIDNEKVRPVLEKLLSRTGRLVVSMDGPAEVHDRQRVFSNGGGSYELLTHFLEKYRSLVEYVDVEAVITPDFPYPFKVISFLHRSGFSKISSKLVRGYPDHFDESCLQEDYRQLFKTLKSDAESGNYSLFSTLRHDHTLRPLWKLIPGIKAQHHCFWGITHVVVDGNGNYHTCDGMIGRDNTAIGHVDDGIDWDLFHQDMSVLNREPCRNCWARYACGGTCYISGLEENENSLTVDPFECRINEFLVRLNLELFVQILKLPKGYVSLRDAFIRN